jgi:hypothetical protein
MGVFRLVRLLARGLDAYGRFFTSAAEILYLLDYMSNDEES